MQYQVQHVASPEYQPSPTDSDVSRSIASRFLHTSREARGTIEAMGEPESEGEAIRRDGT